MNKGYLSNREHEHKNNILVTDSNHNLINQKLLKKCNFEEASQQNKNQIFNIKHRFKKSTNNNTSDKFMSVDNKKQESDDDNSLDIKDNPNWKEEYTKLYNNFFPKDSSGKQSDVKTNADKEEGELSYSEVLDIICKLNFEKENKNDGNYLFFKDEDKQFEHKKSFYLYFFGNAK